MKAEKKVDAKTIAIICGVVLLVGVAARQAFTSVATPAEKTFVPKVQFVPDSEGGQKSVE
jgi:hypothetical protein